MSDQENRISTIRHFFLLHTITQNLVNETFPETNVLDWVNLELEYGNKFLYFI